MKHRAFTLIEMLIVIGVVMILAGMLFFGGRAITASSKEKTTRTTLAALSGMLAEADAKTRFSADQTTALAAPGFVERPAPDGDRDGAAVLATRAIMEQLLAYPINKTAMGQLPAGIIIVDDPATMDDESAWADRNNDGNLDPPLPPLPLDAWNNPIIFVPGGGLTGVTFAQFGDDQPGDFRTVVAPGNRPFWASAGPDGVLGNFDPDSDPLTINSILGGDDNLYSFE